MTTYEHIVLELSNQSNASRIEKRLNDLGREGWHLVATDEHRMFLVRQVSKETVTLG